MYIQDLDREQAQGPGLHVVLHVGPEYGAKPMQSLDPPILPPLEAVLTARSAPTGTQEKRRMSNLKSQTRCAVY